MAEFISTGLGGLVSRPTVRKPAPKSGKRNYERHELMPPPRPPRNFIPTQEDIDTLLERALAALARGMFWDRGSIVNLVL